MQFYTGSQEAVKAHLREKYPRKSDEEEKMYEGAIKARAFDIMRGFLPAGVTTQLSWHTNLRQAHDKLVLLQHHPLEEIRNVANDILAKLKTKYAHSFSHVHTDEQESYWQYLGDKYNYYLEKNYDGDFAFKTNISVDELNKYQDIISKRPAKTGLPHFMTELGNATFEFLIDFGSFRDIQRHRNGVCRMPLLTTRFGFKQWYLDQLPEVVAIEAKKLIEEQTVAIANLGGRPEDLQYYVAMGFNVTAKVSYGLPATLYVTELRSGRMVHPTLRAIAWKMYEALKAKFPDLLMYADLDPDDWDARRGLQTIKEKEEVLKD
jgi:thymidylate synthase ThyX